MDEMTEEERKDDALRLHPIRRTDNDALIGFMLERGGDSVPLSLGDAERVVITIARYMPKAVWRETIKRVWAMRGDDSKLKLVGGG